MSLQGRNSRRKKLLLSSPEKEQCPSCGQSVVVGPMGLSRHFSNFPQCSLDFYREDPGFSADHVSYSPIQLGTMMNDNAPGGHYHDLLSTPVGRDDVCHTASSLGNVDANENCLNDGDYFCLDDAVDDSFLENDFLDPSSEAKMNNTPITFGDSRLQNADAADGLNLALFSLEEEVQVDLLRTLQKLRCPMIAYDEL